MKEAVRTSYRKHFDISNVITIEKPFDIPDEASFKNQSETLSRKPAMSLQGKQCLWSMVFVCLCFLLTSTAYLAWAYTVMDLVSPRMADAASLIGGYLFQAAGIGLFALFLHRDPWGRQVRNALYIVLALHMLCLVPAFKAVTLSQALLFGFLMNLLCGWIAGHYLFILTTAVSAGSGNRAVILGTGYGLSILISWLISLPAKGTVYDSNGILVICLALTAIVFLTVRITLPSAEKTVSGDGDIRVSKMWRGDEKARSFYLPKNLPPRGILLAAGVLVLLFSIVNSSGFGFPSADLQMGISLEFSRLFYAAGLIIAGVVNDRNRRYGAVCALAALVIPFIMLALKGEPVSLMIFWALSYFTFGFYSIYRVILFSDIARERNLLWLSGIGLLAGRVGDAVGEGMNLVLADRLPVLIILSALLFMAAVVMFLKVYHLIYLPEAVQERSEREIFNRFSAKHDLSARERDVLRLLLAEKANSEIAGELSVSESTVKFHIHNLLQKTGCKNRIALLSYYQSDDA